MHSMKDTKEALSKLQVPVKENPPKKEFLSITYSYTNLFWKDGCVNRGHPGSHGMTYKTGLKAPLFPKSPKIPCRELATLFC